jgi:hypothetical protein
METDEQKLEKVFERWSKKLLDDIEEGFRIHIEKVLTEQRMWYQNCVKKMFDQWKVETDKILENLEEK